MVGTADGENLLFIGQDAAWVGEPDINEDLVGEWIEMANVLDRIARGEIVGAAS
jgi:8-oxo-dGDP phosphatase